MENRASMDGVVAAVAATVMAVITSASRPAQAGEAALVVVVETGLGAGCDAAAVRDAVGGELGVAVVAPGELTSAQPSLDTLVVTMDRVRITVALRAGDQWAARSIPAPPERAARLRAIAWLAGNLARDQTTAILQGSQTARNSPESARSGASAPAPAPTEPPPLAASLSTPAASLSATSAENPAPTVSARGWTITLAGGPTASPLFGLGTSVATGGTPRLFSSFNTAWQAEVQRRSGGSLLGGVLETTGGNGGFGAAVFTGRARDRGRWALEANIGLGLEIARLLVPTTTFTNSSMTGFNSISSVSTADRPAIYLRAGVAAGYPLTSSLDLCARAGVHISSGGRTLDYFAATIGVRLAL